MNYTHIKEQIAAMELRGDFDPFLHKVADTMTDMLAVVRAADRVYNELQHSGCPGDDEIVSQVSKALAKLEQDDD